ncbi:MAG: sensor signal transduction histidine kinase [Dehalococcoidia bacterium]|nr:sensor signal transduction histidine kinase [Dehalococcoidia bacterium]
MSESAEEWHRALFEKYVDGVALVVEGLVEYINPALARMSGYSAGEARGRPPAEFVVPEDRARLRDRVSALLAGATESPSEYHLVRKDGSILPVEVVPQLADYGGKTALVSLLRDVSRRKEAVERIQESEARYRAIVDAAPIPLAISRLSDGLILHANAHLGPLFGLPPNEAVGRRTPDFYYDRAEREALLEMVRRDGYVRDYELRSRKADGTEFWVLVSLQTAALDGEEVLVSGFYDITSRKQADEALRQSEERYRILYEDNPAMYFTVDAEGRVLSVNRFGAQRLGYQPEELVGRSVLDVFFAADKKAVLEQLAACVKNPSETGEWEFRKVRKDGSLMWVKEIARAVRAPDGGTMVLIVCEDVTGRRRAEEAAQEAREELESRVERQMQRGNAYGLSFRELTVLNLVAAGKSDKEIANLLGISLGTASKHTGNILGKMGASSRTEAGVRAVRERFLD